jgi:Fe-S-cluster containining protein
MNCFRCGICCELFQARFENNEALRLSEGLGMTVGEFLKRYADPRWPGKDSHIIRHERGACVFLERVEGSTRCSVHGYRPNACREWAAGPDKTECRNGLMRYWGIKMEPSGELDGSPQNLAQFGYFMDRITYG